MKPGHFPDGTPLPLPCIRTPCDGDIMLWPYTIVTGTPSAVREIMHSLGRGYVEHLVAMGFVTVRCGDRHDRTEGAAALASVLGRDVPDTARDAYPELYAERVSFRGLRLPDIGAGLDHVEAGKVLRRAHDLAVGGVQVIASTLSPLSLSLPGWSPWDAVLCVSWDSAPSGVRRVRVSRATVCWQVSQFAGCEVCGGVGLVAVSGGEVDGHG